MLALIVNPNSGGGRTLRALPSVTAELERLGARHAVDTTTSLEHAAELARSAAAAGSMPVAFGGDGLVGAVADALRDSQVTMGILPGGRGNDFARSLGLPRRPRDACSVLVGGTPLRVDLGLAPQRAFIGIATCGLDSAANEIAVSTRLPLGKLVYLYGGLRALSAWKPASFIVTVDDRTTTVRGYTVAVANSASHGGGMRFAPGASATDGLFDVVLVSEMSKLAFLRAMPRVFGGSHVRLQAVTVLRGRDVSVEADRPLAVYADGDPLGRVPLQLTVAPAALSVMVPADRAGVRTDGDLEPRR